MLTVPTDVPSGDNSHHKSKRYLSVFRCSSDGYRVTDPSTAQDIGDDVFDAPPGEFPAWRRNYIPDPDPMSHEIEDSAGMYISLRPLSSD
jgi:hypothetical protein